MSLPSPPFSYHRNGHSPLLLRRLLPLPPTTLPSFELAACLLLSSARVDLLTPCPLPRLLSAVAANGNLTNGNGAAPTPTPSSSETAVAVNGSSTDAPSPPRSPPIVSFSPEQLASLKVQIMAFKLLSRNMPIPPAVQAAVYNPVEALKFVNRADNPDQAALTGPVEPLDANGLTATEVKEAKEAREKALADESPLEEVEDPSSLVYPYNAFVHPVDLLHTAQSGPVRRTLLIPTLLPSGLDPQSLIEERNRFIAARVQQRVSELESFPSNLGQANNGASSAKENDQTGSLSSQKLRALIELKSLNLLARQKALREDVVRGFNQVSSLSLPADRTNFRRFKKQTLREAKLTDEHEAKQKLERERRAKQKHLDHLTEITTHGSNLSLAHRTHQSKFVKLGKAVLKFHADAEKDEQRRVERVSKERLKALRADDEEGYLKLIDTAKDTRITHLLRQTDAFLESLAAAVVEQQNEARDTVGTSAVEQMQLDEPPAEVAAVNESTFGAAPVFEEEQAKDKVDYYGVAHRIKETITQQPSILIGGELKSYQLKGLEWMVSLYNNHVNGILADEMVRCARLLPLSLARDDC